MLRVVEIRIINGKQYIALLDQTDEEVLEQYRKDLKERDRMAAKIFNHVMMLNDED